MWCPRALAGMAALGLLLAGCGAPADAGSTAAGSPDPTATASPTSPDVPAKPVPEPPAPQEPTTTSWGPSIEHWERAGDIVATMTSAQQAGQVIVATYGGLEPPISMVRELNLGGVILMGDNIPQGSTGTAGVAQVVARLRAAANPDVPLIVAVDHEGGPVARASPPVTPFPPGMAHGAADQPALSRAAARAIGRELAALGFTMNVAPVADVTVGPDDPTIGVRSPGGRPDRVGTLAAAQVDGLRAGGVVPVVKHFPGHGSVPADSHLELPVQTASRQQVEQRDLPAFAQAVRAGAPVVMVAHIDVRDVDPGVPSSLSAPVVTGLLRQGLGFEGVVVTDSLAMAAVADRYSPADSAVAALRAGADLLLMPPDARAARDGIVAAVRDGRLDEARLAEAARRVVALQLYQDGLAPPPDASVVGSSAPVSRALSAAAVAVVTGPCVGPYVGDAVQVTGATEADRASFTAAAERAGLATGYGTQVVLLGSSASSGTGDVVVALDAPYGLARSAAATASVALHGRTPQAFEALVDVLTGRVRATGTVPVAVQGLAPSPC